MTEHPEDRSETLAVARTHAALKALRASIWWMCPRSFMNAMCAGMDALDPAEEVSYWKIILGAESGVPAESLTCVPNTPARWRRLFYDFEITPQRLCTTAAAYQNVLPNERDIFLPAAITFDDNGLSLKDRGDEYDRCVIADAYVPSGSSATLGSPDLAGKYEVNYRRVYYYEISSELKQRRGREACFSIGFASSKTSSRMLARMQAGWKPETWGLHSDDGNVFTESGRSAQHLCDEFGPGSVVGAGIVASKSGSRRLFFTLNGEFLGYSPGALPAKGKIFPICGVDCVAWNLHFNFGIKPFLYDIASLPDLEDDIYSSDAGALVPVSIGMERTYGPVWPWHHTPPRRPQAAHFNCRVFLGSWVTSTPEQQWHPVTTGYDEDSAMEDDFDEEEDDDEWSDDNFDGVENDGEEEDGIFFSDVEDDISGFGDFIVEERDLASDDSEMYESVASEQVDGVDEDIGEDTRDDESSTGDV